MTARDCGTFNRVWIQVTMVMTKWLILNNLNTANSFWKYFENINFSVSLKQKGCVSPSLVRLLKAFCFVKQQLRTAVKPVEVSVGFHCVRRKSWLICSKIDPKRKHQRKSQFTDCNYTLAVLSYFTLVCLWCGRTGGRAVTWLPKFLGYISNQIFLPMVLRGARL